MARSRNVTIFTYDTMNVEFLLITIKPQFGEMPAKTNIVRNKKILNRLGTTS